MKNAWIRNDLMTIAITSAIRSITGSSCQRTGAAPLRSGGRVVIGVSPPRSVESATSVGVSSTSVGASTGGGSLARSSVTD